jgi:hypothetical protein
MLKVINKKVTVGINGTISNIFDFEILHNNQLPVIKEVVCMNDLSALRNKFFLTLTKTNSELSNLDEVDMFGLSSAFNEKVSLDAPGGKYNYTVKSQHDTETVLYLQFSLEY